MKIPDHVLAEARQAHIGWPRYGGLMPEDWTDAHVRRFVSFVVERSIDRDAAAVAHARTLGDQLLHNGKAYPDIYQEIEPILQAAFGIGDTDEQQ